MTVFGDGNAFTSSDNGVWANISGSDTHVNFTKSGNVIGLTGLRQTYIGSGNTVWLNSGAVSGIEGSYNRVVMNGSGSYAEIHGSNTNVETSGTEQRIGLTGSQQRVSASASDVWFHAGSDGVLDGSNNSVVLNGSGNYAEIYGANTHVNALGTGGRIELTGSQQRVIASASDVWFHKGSDGVIIGNYDGVVLDGSDNYAEIYGSNTNVNAPVAGQRIGLTGEHQRISANASDVWLHAGSDGTLLGNNNTVVASGTDIQAFISGTDTRLRSDSPGNTFILQGARQSIAATNDAVWFRSDSDFAVTGNGNTVVYDGDSIQGRVSGDSTIAVLKGESNSIYLTGHHLIVRAYHDVITLGPNSDAVIYGRGNTFYKDITSRATFPDEPNRNMNDPSGKSAAELAALMLRAQSPPGQYSAPVATSQFSQFDNFELQIVGNPPLSFNTDLHFWKG